MLKRRMPNRIIKKSVRRPRLRKSKTKFQPTVPGSKSSQVWALLIKYPDLNNIEVMRALEKFHVSLHDVSQARKRMRLKGLSVAHSRSPKSWQPNSKAALVRGAIWELQTGDISTLAKHLSPQGVTVGDVNNVLGRLRKQGVVFSQIDNLKPEKPKPEKPLAIVKANPRPQPSTSHPQSSSVQRTQVQFVQTHSPITSSTMPRRAEFRTEPAWRTARKQWLQKRFFSRA